MIKGIFACDTKGGIGKENKLPWPHSKADMSFFKHVTKGCTVVMGRLTWESLPKKPLPNRVNIVITSSEEEFEGCTKMTMEEAEKYLETTEDEVFIIGGAKVYEHLQKYVNHWYFTVMSGQYDCDTFFKPELSKFRKLGEITITDGILMSFKEYARK
jgi:dihydrofolate reductase